MNIEQVKLAYEALTKTGRGRTSSAVAKETGIPWEEVDRFVAFIKTSPLFRFTLTPAGLLANLEIPRLARGAYTEVREHSGIRRFYTQGKVHKTFAPGDDPLEVQQFAEQHRAEAAAAGALYYAPELDRLNVLAPRVVDCLALLPA